ncbi:MAG: M20/M25/M40 family metallo-hydrolase [Sphingomonadaceae bacterium]|jgi:hypothetical protein|nr:M20/M25/M40 family metallo-hydrolase [Sphingomonadaceae bacterium]MCF8498497.1 M20/M25/M40 family metallo-hydrolase [Sphingomonadaceae bacterium]
MKKFGPVLMALVIAVLLTLFATTPPRAIPANAPAQSFSAIRAMADVQTIAKYPHATGSAENAVVREHIMRRMEALGMEVSTSTGLIDAKGTKRLNRWSGRNDPPASLVNLIGILPGKNRSAPSVVLMSHHDTVWGSPGAADDTTGVAASLEVVRAIRARGQQERDLVMLVTDGEELGLQGARQFWADHPLRKSVGAVINMEARGGGGRTTLFQTSHQNGAAMQVYADAVRRPGASSLAAFIYAVLPNDSDLTPVIKHDYAAYNFAFIGRSGLYHSPMATPDNLDQGSLQDMGGQVLDLTDALLKADKLPQRAADAVFFDLFGIFTVIYPVWLGWVMMIMTAGGMLWVVRQDGTGGLTAGAGRMLALILGSAAILFALNRLSLGLGLAPANYYDRLAAIPRLEAMAALGSLAAFLVLLATWRPSRVGIVGAALPLFIIGLAAQALAPTAAYFLVLPLLLTTFALLARHAAVQIAFMALVGGYMLSLGHQLMQGVGPTLPFAVALPLALAALSALPIWPGMAARKARAITVAALLGASSVSLWVLLDAPAASRAVYSDSKQ